jgi:hypothetical protein
MIFIISEVKKKISKMLSSIIFKNLYQVPPPKPKTVEGVLVEKAKSRSKSKQKVIYEVPPLSREEKIIRKRNSPEIIAPDSNHSPKPQILYDFPQRYNMQTE